MVPKRLPWTCWVTACDMDHGEILLDEHDVGFPARPSHWAWAGTVKRPRKTGMLAVIGFDIGFLSPDRRDDPGHPGISRLATIKKANLPARH